MGRVSGISAGFLAVLCAAVLCWAGAGQAQEPKCEFGEDYCWSLKKCLAWDKDCPEVTLPDIASGKDARNASPAAAARPGKPAPDGAGPSSGPGKSPEAASIEWILAGNGLFMSRREVTVGQYRSCVKAGQCSEPRTGGFCSWTPAEKPVPEQAPVNCVTQAQASAFCKWVGGRIPSAREWEDEAGLRGTYPWGSAPPDCSRALYGWKSADQWGCAQQIQNLSGCSRHNGDSAAGICDLAGGVAEWTSTILPDLQVATKGGSWRSPPEELKSSTHVPLFPGLANERVGIRCVRGSR
ncbi:MAG: Hercynine oxygenase [Myxococcota bacterium]|nr:Hercynine oxygenase [Myxococcota bacterium]